MGGISPVFPRILIEIQLEKGSTLTMSLPCHEQNRSLKLLGMTPLMGETFFEMQTHSKHDKPIKGMNSEQKNEKIDSQPEIL